MGKKKILQHYDYVNALASAKCSSQQDAEDLAAETMLAAFAFLHNGGIITHPKTWFASTLMHKYYSSPFKKYLDWSPIYTNNLVYGDGNYT